MRPGTYKLTRDVKNPHPDRRAKMWTYWAVIPAGKIFVANVYGRLTMKGERFGDIEPDTELGKLIVEYLVDEPQDVATVLRKYDANHWHVFAIPELLIKHGVLTLEQLDKALEAYHNAPEKDET